MKFISEPDHGMYEAINKGIRMATGDVIALCHSDDFMFAKDTVSHVVKKMEETECDFLYADGIFVNERNTNKVVRKWIGGKYARWKVRCGWLPLHPTCYIKREVMMKCGLYDESYKIAADTNLLVNYLYNCHLKVAYLPEFVTRMRMGGMSTDSAKRKKVWDEDIRVYTGYGFKPVTLTKLMKMAWKVPQFVQAKFMKLFFEFHHLPLAKRSFFRKPTRPSLPLRKAPPLISVFSPQGRRGKPPSGALNRYAIRLADHQRSAPSCAGWDRLGEGFSIVLCCW